MWLNSKSLGLIETETSLEWIFRGLGVRLFIRHVFVKWFPGEKKRNQVSIQKKKSLNNYGMVVKVMAFQAESPRFYSPQINKTFRLGVYASQ